MKAVKKPSPSDVAEVAKALGKEQYSRYFFHGLDNPAWLEPLYREGIFKHPPPIIERASDAGVATETPRWPAGQYLVDMAPLCPDTVARIALELETNNPTAYLDLIRAAVGMPAYQAGQVVPAVIKWFHGSTLWLDMLADAAQTLLAHLAEGGQPEGALHLLKALTEPESVRHPVPRTGDAHHVRVEARCRYRPWYLRQFLEKTLPGLPQLAPLEVAHVLDEQLRKCMEIEAGQPPGGDGSHLWRPAIEDHSQNWGEHRLKNILTVGLRDALAGALETDPMRLRPVVERYLSDDLSLFRRLALHLIRLGGEHYGDLADGALQDQGFRQDTALHHEYYRLLQNHFASLPQDAQDDHLEWIKKGPELALQARGVDDATGSPVSEQQIERFKQHWQLRQLAPIRDALPRKWRQEYSRLRSEFGEPEHPDFLFWSSTTWVGPTSPKDKAELKAMPASEVLKYLSAFQPSADWFDHSREGLGGQLEVVVKQKPQEYQSIGLDFVAQKLHPTYVYHLVRGLHEAWKEGFDPDWSAILRLCEPISLPLTDPTASLVDLPMAMDDVDWSGVRMAIGRFFSGVLQRDDRLFPVELMPRFRDVLLRFMHDADPKHEDDATYAQGTTDWPTARINSTRGVAASALLQYALRYARMHKARHDARKDSDGYAVRLEPRVRQAFTEMLDKREEPSPAIHSLFGEFFANFLWLDRHWTVDNLENIFPPGARKQRYWEAAWEGYMLYSRPFYREVYELLRPQYCRAISALTEDQDSRALNRTQHSLAQHLALAYRLGLEDFSRHAEQEPPPSPVPKGDHSLLDAFLQVASDQLRATVARAVGGGLQRDKPTAHEDWERLRGYWEARVAAAQRESEAQSFDEELSAFASWLDGVPESLNELAPLLAPMIDHLTTGHRAHDILHYLSRESEHSPFQAVRLLRKLLDRKAALDEQAPHDSIYLWGAEDDIWAILENALASAGRAREQAVSVINLLGERGEYVYRGLLK